MSEQTKEEFLKKMNGLLNPKVKARLIQEVANLALQLTLLEQTEVVKQSTQKLILSLYCAAYNNFRDIHYNPEWDLLTDYFSEAELQDLEISLAETPSDEEEAKNTKRSARESLETLKDCRDNQADNLLGIPVTIPRSTEAEQQIAEFWSNVEFPVSRIARFAHCLSFISEEKYIMDKLRQTLAGIKLCAENNNPNAVFNGFDDEASFDSFLEQLSENLDLESPIHQLSHKAQWRREACYCLTRGTNVIFRKLFSTKSDAEVLPFVKNSAKHYDKYGNILQ